MDTYELSAATVCPKTLFVMDGSDSYDTRCVEGKSLGGGTLNVARFPSFVMYPFTCVDAARRIAGDLYCG